MKAPEMNNNQLIADFFKLKPEALDRTADVMRQLNDSGSVVYIPEMDIYAVTGYEAVCNVGRRPEEFSSKYVTGRVREDGSVHALINADPPDHTRQKMFVGRAFQPANLADREPIIREVVNEVIDEHVEQGQFKLVEDFALKFPVYTISALLGVPIDDRERFVDWAMAHVIPIGNPTLTKEQYQTEIEPKLDAFAEYFLKVIEDRRKDPKDDFISLMVAKSEGGDLAGELRPLSNDEMIVILRQLLTGGIETTAKLMTSAVEMLIEHPDQLAEVKNDFSLIPGMLDETLRIKAPVRGMFRYTTRDAEVEGVTIPKHSVVWLVFASGGHDEGVFECPYKFDIHRGNAKRHLSFGIGNHRCIGFGLAMLQARVGFEQLFSRIGDFRVAKNQEREPFPSYVIQGLNELVIEF